MAHERIGGVTRRQFLRTAAGAAVAPAIITAAALGANGRAAASNRIGVGLIGVGNMGSGHLGGLLNNRDVQLLAICDVDRAKRDKAAARVQQAYGDAIKKGTYAGCDLYNEYEKLLARADIDAVLIAVPEHWHAIIAIHAARAGKDIYCEKPLSLTVREARLMVQAVRRYGRVFQTGSQQRSANNFRYACELVRNGRIGQVKKVNVGIGGPSSHRRFPAQKAPEGFDWERWQGPAPWAEYNRERCSGSYSGGWRLVRDYSGGMTTDWGAHHFDIAQWGLGMDASGPVEIVPPGVDGVGTLTYRYGDGVVMERGGANGIKFTGTDGVVEVNRGYFRTWPDEIGKQPIGPRDVRLYRSPGHHQDWIACIRSRGRPVADVEIGCRTVTVCHLGNIASWLGRKIAWDPAAERIVGDAAAERWLDRPKRAPWRI